MLTSVIIPVWNMYEYTLETITSLLETTNPDNLEIIVVDNGSTDATASVIKDLGIHKLIINEQNMGFPIAVNQGIREATGDYICIANNDLVFTKDWLDHLIWHLENTVDMVGPCTNVISGPQARLIDIYSNIEELNQQATIFYKKNKHKIMPFHRLVGFCLLMKKQVIDKVGLLNEIFSPGLYEDDDYCLRAIEAGFTLGISECVYIHHMGSATFKAIDVDYAKLLLKNKGIFEAHWPEEEIERLAKVNRDKVRSKKING